MNKIQVVTLRIPVEMKKRLERESKYQGVSLNQLTNYLLNVQLTQMELISSLELRLKRKSISALKSRVNQILNKIPSRRVPDWDLK
ncbi:MAG: hypothetical protein AB1414_16865 [bacterium]